MGPSRLLSVGKFAMSLGLAAALAGCMSSPDAFESNKPPALIPTNATRVAEGPPPLSYIPTSVSTVYILDDAAQALVNTSEILTPSSGRFFVVDSTQKAIMMKNTNDSTQQIVLAAPIDPSHRFSIWVVRASPSTQP
jgi:hypothetical protein